MHELRLANDASVGSVGSDLYFLSEGILALLLSLSVAEECCTLLRFKVILRFLLLELNALLVWQRVCVG